MGDMRASSEMSKDNLVSIDPYALVEALIGQRIDKLELGSSEGLPNDYDDLDMNLETRSSSGRGRIRPDSPPKDVKIGCINPYALVEALLGRNIDRNSMDSAKIMSHVLQTDYDELFDMKNSSVLFSGLRLNQKDRRAEMLSEKDIRILEEKDLITPDLSEAQRLGDLERIGLKDFEKTRVKAARMQNGKLHLVLHAHSLGRTLSNHEVTMSINELVNPYRMQKGHWTPPNSTWRDMYDQVFQEGTKRLIGNLTSFEINERRNTLHHFDDPIQGCASNSWLISALFSVFWANPHAINRATRVHQDKDERKQLSVKFHDKGGKDNNGRTETVEVDYKIPINNSNNEPLYCRSSDGADIWPSLYEKAYAKWITGGHSDRPDVTQTHCGDPVKAMAQINGREPHYFETQHHSASDLVGLVRCNSVNFKTINPMVAWTYATGEGGNEYRGSNIVANHAYSVLGFCVVGNKQYIVLRNPWGVTEPIGLTSYQGLLERVDPCIWHPASMLDHGGLFAIEEQAFKHAFAYIGVAK